MKKSWLAATAAALALTACGGGTAQQEADTTTVAGDAPGAGATEAGAPGPITGPPRPWEQMSMHEHKRYMVDEVLPRMAPLFAQYNPQEFSDFRCENCHGPDPRSRHFEMPNPRLPRLPTSGSEGHRRLVREHPQAVRFMFNHVLPTMQQLLGAPDYDPETGEGFSCFACHTHADGAATRDDDDEGEAEAGDDDDAGGQDED